MKNLILIRHAKSSWETMCQDIDRTLEKRGKEDIKLVAIDCISYLPFNFEIHSSIARRAHETALLFAKNISFPVEKIIFKEELYTFDENKLENSIKSISNDLENVIIFGHNEAITNFVNKFGTIFIDNVPTAGFVWLQFEIDDWSKLEKGVTKKTIFPKNVR